MAELAEPILNPDMMPKDSLEQILTSMIERATNVTEVLAKASFDNETNSKKVKTYSITKAAKVVGKTTQSIRAAEKSGAFPAPKLNENGRRAGYTLNDINNMRAHFKIRTGRLDSEKPAIMSFQNFKGGVGKTTLSCHFAQYLAEKGYRVLLIDADSQASTTMTFGFKGGDIVQEHTLYPCLVGDEDTLHYAIRETHWDQLHVVPASLDLYGAEYQLAAFAGNKDDQSWVEALKDGIKSVESNYDVILIDAPPALGMISLNVLKSLTGLVIPAPAAMMDFHSTATFLAMLKEVMGAVATDYSDGSQFDFFKIMLSKYDGSRPSQDFVARLTGQQFSEHMLNNWFIQSAEIDNASSKWHTVYELDSPTGSARTYKRCVDSMNAVFSDVEHEIRMTWPSHAKEIRGLAA